MRGRALLTLVCFFLVGCGGDSGSNSIVGLMVSPASATSSVGAGVDFTANIQYVDGHQSPLSSAQWSIQGTASQLMNPSGNGSSVTVLCIRPSDYFANGYVGDNVMARAEFKGQTYIGTASLVCR
jgi:hypothetical protein